jgi:hypothetical protein
MGQRSMKTIKSLNAIFIIWVLIGGPANNSVWADDPDAPVISFAIVETDNRPYGLYWVPTLFGYYALVVQDPNGSVPDTLAEVKVSGPEGFTYIFDLNSELYTRVDGQKSYGHHEADVPTEGEYTFTVTDMEGKKAIRTFNYTASPYTIPLPDRRSYVPVWDAEVSSTTPTLSWDPVSYDGGTVHYQVVIFINLAAKYYLVSPRITSTTFTVPAGILRSCEVYPWIAIARDSGDPVQEKTRATGIMSRFTTACDETYSFERMWPTLQQPWYFFNPGGMAVDANNNFYVANTGHFCIQKFNSNGQFITTWKGRAGARYGNLSFPTGMATDASGNVYVADTGNHRIQKFTSNGDFITQWGSAGSVSIYA